MISPTSGNENTATRRDGRRVAFSASRVSRAIRAITSSSASADQIRQRWLEAVATRAMSARPDLVGSLRDILRTDPSGPDHLLGLTIGEIGVCYEALLASIDREDRKSAGQFFTPDDAARFMAAQSVDFGSGIWLDPCCGVGNLSWHLASFQPDPGDFVRNRLVLIDLDDIALRTAVSLIGADWAGPASDEAIRALYARSQQRDFLSNAELPAHDFVILNPPYARAEERLGFETSRSKDLFAFFIEKVSKSARGFISVTPASYLSAPKFQSLRDVVNREFCGGNVFAFDNVPDTLFRGYKYGSNNTSKTNFVRAAVTVCAPRSASWAITPIIRWVAATRATMFEECSRLLAPRRIGPHGEWAKLGPGMETVWDQLFESTTTVADLVVKRETQWSLDVALTPRYYISATRRSLDRTSKATLYFASASDRDRVAITLNSSIPYFWWRSLDGGVTLPRRVLMSTPVPAVHPPAQVLDSLWKSERENLVIKLNAGRENENVKHSNELVMDLNRLTIRGEHRLDILYAPSMFPLADILSQEQQQNDERATIDDVSGIRKSRVRHSA